MLQENDEVDQRLSSIRDTSFSWESIDSQVGSRQSLLDNKGRSRLLVEEQETRTDKVGVKAASVGGWCATPNGGDDMDLTRRQRDQRKKDIREKVHNSIEDTFKPNGHARVCVDHISLFKTFLARD